MDQKERLIIEQAQKLYQRYGIKSVTMDDVASRLGISKKTLYEHFRDKEDLVRQILLREQDSRYGFISSVEHKNLNAIEELFELYKIIHTFLKEYNPAMEYDIHKYYPDLFMEIKYIRRKHFFESVHDNILKGKKEGFYRKELNAKIIAKLHVHSTESILTNDLFTQEELISFKILNEGFVYHIQGILSEKGRQFFKKFSERLNLSRISIV